MKIIRLAAVVVTALFALMNLGAAADSDVTTWVRVGGAVLAVAGVAAAVGLATNKSWGIAATIAVGVLNAVGGLIALIADEDGGPIGIVAGGLAVLLAVLARQTSADRTHA